MSQLQDHNQLRLPFYNEDKKQAFAMAQMWFFSLCQESFPKFKFNN